MSLKRRHLRHGTTLPRCERTSVVRRLPIQMATKGRDCDGSSGGCGDLRERVPCLISSTALLGKACFRVPELVRLSIDLTDFPRKCVSISFASALVSLELK